MHKFLVSLLAIAFLAGFVQPSLAFVQCDSSRVVAHLKWLTSGVNGGSRDYQNSRGLDQTAHYLKENFSKYADSVKVQQFVVNGKTYANVIASFGTSHDDRLIVGAHYDVCGNQPGADDNASGTTALLELARMLQGLSLPHRIDLVAYTLEEPPFFRTQNMGSFYHAHYLKENNIQVLGMVCIEMIGYFSNKKGSQSYPSSIMKLFYGNKGDYIAVVQKTGNGKFGRKFNRAFKKKTAIEVHSVKAPTWVSGIDFSDHLNYWTLGYSAVMITDTSFYRNPNYHLPSDTIETLDIERMCLVIDQVFRTIKQPL
jgi:Zn-dependent M28 family amino/carboxypeptidase